MELPKWRGFFSWIRIYYVAWRPLAPGETYNSEKHHAADQRRATTSTAEFLAAPSNNHLYQKAGATHLITFLQLVNRIHGVDISVWNFFPLFHIYYKVLLLL